MAIIYSYQENEDLLNSDMLVGTATTLHNGKVRKITKNFTLGQLKTFINTGDLILSNGGTSGPATLIDNILNIPVYQGQITLTTTGSSGAATLIGNTLNIPQYGGTPPTPTLNQVLTAGNTSQIDANVGIIGLYDSFNSNYSYITGDRNRINFYSDPTTRLGYFGNNTIAFDNNGFLISIKGPDTLTANRTIKFPDATGTVALTSDIPVVTTPTLQQVTTAGNTTTDAVTLGTTTIKQSTGTSVAIFKDNTNATVGTVSEFGSLNFIGASHTFGATGNAELIAGTYRTQNYGDGFKDAGNNVNFVASLNTGSTFGWSSKGTIEYAADYSANFGNRTLVDKAYVLSVIPSLTGYVPTSRSLTINGTAYDLTADRSWSVGTVTSVGLSMPSAFTVSSSPVTGSGTIAVTGAGTVSQYVRGDGTLANFPNSTGGGSSINYYLNGSISQGTFGGDTYYQMSKTPILGAGTNFTRTNGAGNGYIASFITDAGDPSFLNIPGGNWNLELYFQSSASGGSPQFYGEIYKVSATNVFTLVASGSANPEGITNGTTIDQYFTSIPVPQTSLLITDRLAIRIYVITGGRTITLHTENGNLCEVLTTFTTGLTALNWLTTQVQYFAVGTSGTDFNISSATDTHTFNLPTASATNRGALSSADWSAFNGKFTLPSLTSGSVIFSNGTTLAQDNANFFWDDTNNRLGIGKSNPTQALDVNGVIKTNVGITYNYIPGDIWYTGIAPGGDYEMYNFYISQQALAISLSNNYVGIGTSSPAEKLHVDGNMRLINSATSVDTITFSNGPQIEANGPVGYFKSGEVYTNTISSNVGIGTSSPTNKLDVNGVIRGVLPDPSGLGGVTAKLLSFSPSPYGLVFRGYSSGAHSIQSQREANDAEMYPLILQPNGNNVGIRTLTPTTELDVNGVITATGGNSTSWNAKQNALLDIASVQDNGIYSTFMNGAISYFLAGIGAATFNNLRINSNFNLSGNTAYFSNYAIQFSTTATAGTLAWQRGVPFYHLGRSLFRFQPNVVSAGARYFVGLSNLYQVSNPTNVEPTTLTQTIGVAKLSTSANLFIIHNDGTGTATSFDLGVNYPATSNLYIYDIKITSTGSSSPTGSGGVYTGVTVRRTTVSTGATISTDYTVPGDYPAGGINPALWITNNATAIANSLYYFGAITYNSTI